MKSIRMCGTSIFNSKSKRKDKKEGKKEKNKEKNLCAKYVAHLCKWFKHLVVSSQGINTYKNFEIFKKQYFFLILRNL